MISSQTVKLEEGERYGDYNGGRGAEHQRGPGTETLVRGSGGKAFQTLTTILLTYTRQTCRACRFSVFYSVQCGSVSESRVVSLNPPVTAI